MNIAVMPGDGIGKEVTAEAVKVLQVVAGRDVKFTEAPIGAAGVAAAGVPLPPATLELAREADAILFGAVGMPGDDSGPRDKRPELGLLTLRKRAEAVRQLPAGVPVPRAGRRLVAQARAGRRGSTS